MPKHNEMIRWGWQGQSYWPGVWKRYKITNIEFDKMWYAQEGKCACGKPFAHPFLPWPGWPAAKPEGGPFVGFRPEIDHQHIKVNGKEKQCEAKDVRGLLCGECNSLLGDLRDNRDYIIESLPYRTDKARLCNLVIYLERHGGLKNV